MNAAQMVQDHWEFMQRITNDDDEAQHLALRVLEKFEQFKPERSTFGQFIKLKHRELRQHYSDGGVVGHPCRKELGDMSRLMRLTTPMIRAMMRRLSATSTTCLHHHGCRRVSRMRLPS